MKTKKKLIVISLVLFVNYIFVGQVAAEVGFGFYKSQLVFADSIVDNKLVLEDTQTMPLSEGDFGGTLNFDFFDNRLGLEVPAGFITAPSELTAKKYSQGMELPWNMDRLSDIYEVSFSPTFGFDNKKALTITLAYDQANNYFKQVYYYDQADNLWKAIPTTDFPDKKIVKAALSKTAVQVAIFANPKILTIGKASWYKYKGGLFTASPDFPKGSKLRVTNLANGKSVEVEVNDWGPERDKHPDRVVDLDKEAFAAIASTGDGIIDVIVSPISLTADTNGRVLGVKAEGLASQPKLSSRSVVVINETTGEVILDKNSQDNLPLASLSKIVALKVFLETDPNLEEVVAYKLVDEEYNYRYCKSWESAKINLKEGEKLKIKDLVYSALVGSANNAVESLVRVSGLSRQDFINKMNEQAKIWGATKTKFIEPTGLSSSNVSSAMDYALIMKEALTDELLAKISSTPTYTFKTLAGKSHTLKNTNKLIADQAQANLQAEKYAINGSKTGYLVEAGYCLATRVKSGQNNFIIVSLGAPTREKSFNETADLIKYLDRII